MKKIKTKYVSTRCLNGAFVSSDSRQLYRTLQGFHTGLSSIHRLQTLITSPLITLFLCFFFFFSLLYYMYLHQSAVLDYTYVADVFGVIVIACCQIPSVHVHISLSTFRSHREEKNTNSSAPCDANDCKPSQSLRKTIRS